MFKNVLAVRPTKTIYRDGDKVIKLFMDGYSKSDVLNEALNQARVEETDLNVPGIIEVCKIDGRWAIVMDYIEGKTLDKLMEENPDKVDEYLSRFVDLQITMHSKKAPNLNKIKDKMLRKITQSDLDSHIKYELKIRIESMPTHDKLCHGDYNPANIIVAPDQTFYIIDWSHATQGNASADVARTFLLFNLAGKADLAEKYVDLFCLRPQEIGRMVP